MKRYNNIYPKIYDMENLIQAHNEARKHKTHYKAVQKVDADVPYYLSIIQQKLRNKEYKINLKDYSVSTINDKGKERELWKLPYFPHRIIQWAILLQIEPIFNKVFTDFTCASLPNRGISKASRMMRNALKDVENTQYCLKIDVRHFYPNIDHDILKSMLRKKFKDKELLELLDMIIDSHPPKGIPIGSYLSQYLGNFYLSYFDHWLKEVLKAKYIVRYMDDVVILDSSKERLHEMRKAMDKYLTDNLHLTLKQNWQIFPVDYRGVDFVGYRFFHDYILLRKSTCKRMKKRILKVQYKIENDKPLTMNDFSSVNSYAGLLKWCNSYKLKQKYILSVTPDMLMYYIYGIKGKQTLKSTTQVLDANATQEHINDLIHVYSILTE